MEKPSLKEHERQADITSRLITEIYHGKSFQAIADRGAELLGNPLCIFDTSFKALAVTSDYASSEYVKMNQETSGYLKDNSLDILKKSQYLYILSTSNSPVRSSELQVNSFHNLDAEYGWIDSVIRLHGIVVGYISVCGLNRPFTDNDLLMTEKLVEFSAMEFQKDPIFLQTHGVEFEALLIDCLRGRVSDPRTFQNRMRALSRKFEPPYYIIVLHHSLPESNPAGFVQGFQAMLNRYFPVSISAPYENNVVLFVSAKNPGAYVFHEQDEEDLHLFLTQNTLTLGISNSFTQPHEVPECYRQALFCAAVQVDGPVRSYKDFVMEYTLSRLKKDVSVLNLCHPALLELSQSKKSSDRDMLITLYHYLNHMKNSEKVAEMLHIHKNTLFYRVNKMKDLLDVDFNNGNDVLYILFSYKILNLDL